MEMNMIFDFTVTKENLSLGYPLFSLSLYIIIYLFFKRGIYLSTQANGTKIKLYLLILIFITTSFFDGDFFHYMEIVQNFNIIYASHLEEIYTPIILFVDRNYLFFRIVVWGSALLITTIVFKRLKLNNLYLYVFLFFTLYIIRFSYVRAALAYALYFLGTSFLIKEYYNKYLSFILGVALIYISSLFHNSAILLVAMTVMLLIPLNKKVLICIVLLLPIVYVLLNDLFNYLLIQDNLGANGVISHKMSYYTESEQTGMGISELLLLLSEIVTFYGFYVYFLLDYCKKKYNDTILLGCYKIVLGILFVAFYLFMLDSANKYLFPRIMEMSYIPMVVIICRSYELGYLKQVNLNKILLLGMVVSIMRLSYSIYLTIL